MTFPRLPSGSGMAPPSSLLLSQPLLSWTTLQGDHRAGEGGAGLYHQGPSTVWVDFIDKLGG